jgi:hypothetical protein
MKAHRPKLVCAAVTLLVALAATAGAFAGATRTDGSASGRVYALPFSVYCTSTYGRSALVAPRVLGAHAQLTVPAAWRTIRVPPNTTSSGGGCGQPYLLTDRRGDANLCLQETVYATMSPAAGSDTPAAFLARGYRVLARGRLPTIAGMRGVWEELDVGEEEPAYGVDAAYEAADHRAFYELDVVPPFPAQGCPASTGSQARGIARQLASSFRVDVTDKNTAETTR